MAIGPKSFLYTHDVDSGIATLTFNRPQKLNALTFQVYRELVETFRALDEEPHVRAIVLTGQGRAFCTGGDVEDIIGPLLERDFEGLHEFTRMTCDLIAAIRKCRRPVIAALNGTVAGAGAVIATAADVRIAASSAKIAYLFTKVGLSGADMGVAWLLPRIVGLGRATELLLTGDFIDAEEAFRIGLYNQVVADDHVLEVALNFAEKIAAGPSYAHGVTKEALDKESTMDVYSALEAEAYAQAVCMQMDDFKEGYWAFVEKRTPNFNQSISGGHVDPRKADRERA
jgi:enoyl-CoA hydratase/carnithine racemase